MVDYVSRPIVYQAVLLKIIVHDQDPPPPNGPKIKNVHPMQISSNTT